MKAFEGWNAEQDNESTFSGDVGEIRHRIEERRETWKAALIEVLEQCHHYQTQDVIDWILQELES